MAIENLMNSQKTALLRPRVLQEAQLLKINDDNLRHPSFCNDDLVAVFNFINKI